MAMYIGQAELRGSIHAARKQLFRQAGRIAKLKKHAAVADEAVRRFRTDENCMNSHIGSILEQVFLNVMVKHPDDVVPILAYLAKNGYRHHGAVEDKPDQQKRNYLLTTAAVKPSWHNANIDFTVTFGGDGACQFVVESEEEKVVPESTYTVKKYKIKCDGAQ